VQLGDTSGTTVWLLAPGWPANSTILDAVEVPLSAPAQLGTGAPPTPTPRSSPWSKPTRPPGPIRW
jgi:hypothetical protein